MSSPTQPRLFNNSAGPHSLYYTAGTTIACENVNPPTPSQPLWMGSSEQLLDRQLRFGLVCFVCFVVVLFCLFCFVCFVVVVWIFLLQYNNYTEAIISGGKTTTKQNKHNCTFNFTCLFFSRTVMCILTDSVKMWQHKEYLL